MTNDRTDAVEIPFDADKAPSTPDRANPEPKASASRKEEKGIRWLGLGLYLPTGLALMAVVATSAKTGIPISVFTRDPADIAHISPFAGVLSNIGVLLWCATATLCLLTFLLLRVVENLQGLHQFFLVSGIITIVLMLDDLFLFHEKIFPQYLHIRQRHVYLVHTIMVCAYLISFRKIILRENRSLLMLALVFLSLSIGADVAAPSIAKTSPYYHLFEDGFKLFGIVSWLGYFGRLSLQSFRSHATVVRSSTESSDRW